MSTDPAIPWYDRFFRHEYLVFDAHPNTDREIAFLLEAMRPEADARILDVGCGYGRHMIPLAQEGFFAVGLDRSPVMLSAARQKAAEARRPPVFLRADMRAIPFVDAFDIALSLFSSLGYFEAEDDNFRVLQNIAAALVPDGQLLIETVNRDFVVRHLVPTQVYRPPGMLLIEERQFDLVTSRSRVDVTVIQNGSETHLHHTIRLYTFTELEMLLSAAGLVPRGVWGDFQGGDYTCDAPHMIVLAEKP